MKLSEIYLVNQSDTELNICWQQSCLDLGSTYNARLVKQ